LAAIQGIRHGGMVARVEALLREIPSPAMTERLLADRLKRGEALPGFGHQLYPQGDPRARLLLDRIAALDPNSETIALARSIEASAYALIQEKPTIDFALAMLARALHLPENSGATLFALGRTAGWIAHAREQYRLEELIRPRAKYNGPVPKE
jgi:citrate synthase